MSKYSSKPVVVSRPAAEIAEKFSDFRRVQDALDGLDAEQKAKVGDVSFTEDSVMLNTPQVGQIVLKVVDRTPHHIVLEAQKSPVPMKLEVGFLPVDDSSTEVTGSIDVDMPAMLRPIVGPTLQKAADQFGTLFAKLA